MLMTGGGPEPREQRGRPFPTIKCALVILPTRERGGVMLHAMDCPRLALHERDRKLGLCEIVWSTTYPELDDHASERFGEEGWMYCPSCFPEDAGGTK